MLLRIKQNHQVGFYKLLNDGKFARQNTPTCAKRTRRHRDHDIHQVDLVALSTHQIIEGLKFKKKPKLLQACKHSITAGQFRILEAHGFDKTWRSGLDWLSQMKLPTKRSDCHGNMIGILLDTFRIRINKNSLLYFDENIQVRSTKEIYIFHQQFMNDQ